MTMKWGFYAHKFINRIAIFTLPEEMIGFYKHHIHYLTENAVNPDRRRYAVEGEAPKHYIDIDVYGDSAIYTLPRYWDEAVETYTEDTLMAYGIVPWQINFIHYQLTDAFSIGDVDQIVRISADLGHYVADSNVPLHTTKNYNGQLTDQKGIHGFWESRLPELYHSSYNVFTGKAKYIDNVQLEAWKGVIQAHLALDSVLLFEKELSERISEDKKYTFEQRGQNTIKTYSKNFSNHYHKALNGMVERQMKRSIKMVGDIWYTCWVNAGQPDLNKLIDIPFTEEELAQRKQLLEEWKKQKYESRSHEH
ncbi:MAG: zinc dependent phospholipase C family protein [Cyclobacteriaceae bacterium]|nr:zinc dependent phospholipase C family protein [Cyclobacteriaceae bacterium]